MIRIVIVILLYHRHKPLDLSHRLSGLRFFMTFPVFQVSNGIVFGAHLQ
jgi:hypothetical protein